MKIKLSDIHIKNRVREDMGNIKELAQDFNDNGQITAITVRPRNAQEIEEGVDKPWVLVAGGRRLAAALTLGWDEIEASAREEMGNVQHRILELNENLKRKHMTWDEESKAKREIFELRKSVDPEITAAEVAREIGESAANFSRAIKVADAIDEDPDIVNAGSVKAALRVKKLTDETKGRKARSADDKKLVEKLNLRKRLAIADMRTWSKGKPDAHADLVVVDFPYGGNYWKSGHKSLARLEDSRKQQGISHYDDTPEYAFQLMADTIPELIRLTKPTGWLALFGNWDSFHAMQHMVNNCCTTHWGYRIEGEKVCERAEAGGAPCEFAQAQERPWIWYRPNSQNNPRYPEIHAKNFYELILIVNRGEGRIRSSDGQSSVSNVLVHDAEYGEVRIHANQKPVELYQNLVERFTDEGDLVIDPCYGSGAGLAAAGSMRRYFEGCELNKALQKPAMGLVSKYLVPMPGLLDSDPNADDKDHFVEAVDGSKTAVRTAKEVKIVLEGHDHYARAEEYAAGINFGASPDELTHLLDEDEAHETAGSN